MQEKLILIHVKVSTIKLKSLLAADRCSKPFVRGVSV